MRRSRPLPSDTEKPVVRCPADVSEVTTGDSAAVDFPLAAASDNLALEGDLQYSHANGSVFRAGTTAVVVEALDTFGNKGECQFAVIVHKKGEGTRVSAGIGSRAEP